MLNTLLNLLTLLGIMIVGSMILITGITIIFVLVCLIYNIFKGIIKGGKND